MAVHQSAAQIFAGGRPRQLSAELEEVASTPLGLLVVHLIAADTPQLIDARADQDIEKIRERARGHDKYELGEASILRQKQLDGSGTRGEVAQQLDVTGRRHIKLVASAPISNLGCTQIALVQAEADALGALNTGVVAGIAPPAETRPGRLRGTEQHLMPAERQCASDRVAGSATEAMCA